MKKIIISCIAIMATIVSNAQKVIIADSSTMIKLADTKIKNGDFNVLLSGKNDPEKVYAFWGFTDTTADNTFKKRSDNEYDIYVKNLARDIFLVKKTIEYGYGTNLDYNKGTEDNHSWPLMDFEHPLYKISYVENNDTINYDNAFLFDPYLTRYRLEAPGTHDFRTFIFHYTFPKPILTFIVTDEKLIEKKRKDPSYDFIIDDSLNMYSHNDKNIFSSKKNSILLGFEHFGIFFVRNTNNQLKYKVDSFVDWSSTALANTPSILLENLSVGNHTLYVKYPSDDAEILEYHFTIAPN